MSLGFLAPVGKKPSDILFRICLRNRRSCMNRANVYKWVDSFKRSRTSVSDGTLCGHKVVLYVTPLELKIGGVRWIIYFF